ncbi:MAG: FimV/HubP family polar landmark protein [Ectothiorhodospiraceae bacterium]|jgi:pilus assembly protein FimV
MGRKLATVLLLAVLGFSSSVSALGLGKIESRTALNEPLVARIPLLSVQVEDISQINVSLASPEAFQRSGIDRPFTLAQLKFSVAQEGGKPYIAIRSNRPIKEPFLDFLIQVRWPRGQLVREYTLLLDPPVYADEPAGAAAVGGGSASAGGGSAASDTGTATAAPATSRSGSVASASDAGPATYGPVQANETLWGVATRVRPNDSVSVRQTMVALLRANPDAFIAGDMNRLKRGSVLRVPAGADIASIGRDEAAREVRAQIAKWRERNAAEQADSGQTAESGQTESAEGGENAPEGRLSVVAPKDSAGQEAGTSLVDRDLAPTKQNVGRLQEQLTTLEESNASLESENKDLRSQVEAMRDEMAKLQAQINIQADQAIGAGDQQAETQTSQGAGSATAPEQSQSAGAAEEAMPESAEDTAPDAASTTETEAAPVVSDSVTDSQADMAAETPSKPESEQQAEPAESAPTATEKPASEADDQKPKSEQKPASTTPAERKPATLSERAMDLVNTVVQDKRMLAIGGLAVLLLLLLLMMVARRRRAASEETIDTRLPIDQSADVPPADTFQFEEAAAEADSAPNVDELIASGQYQAAQEALDEELGEDPYDTARRLKLLEVLAKLDDRGGFEAEAQVLYTQLEDRNDPVWQRAVELGREIAPENPLFSTDADEGDAAAGFEAALAGLAAEDRDEDDGKAGFDADDYGTGISQAAADDVDAAEDAPESGLEEGDEPEPRAEEALDYSAAAESAGDAPDGLPNAEAAGAYGVDAMGGPADMTEEEGEPEEDDALEFSLDAALEDEPAGEDVEAEPSTEPSGEDEDDFEALEFELPDDLEDDDATAADAGASSGDEDNDDALDSLDFGDFSLDDGEAPEDQPGGDADLDPEALDEVSTKLDLARAYMDMGDSEGARSLLDEVVEEGTDDQRREAETLLQNVG